jgi:hypothetical protein
MRIIGLCNCIRTRGWCQGQLASWVHFCSGTPPCSLPCPPFYSHATCNLVRALSVGTCKQIDRNSIACTRVVSFLLATRLSQTLLAGCR